jgi:hypothetical protein
MYRFLEGAANQYMTRAVTTVTRQIMRLGTRLPAHGRV